MCFQKETRRSNRLCASYGVIAGKLMSRNRLYQLAYLLGSRSRKARKGGSTGALAYLELHCLSVQLWHDGAHPTGPFTEAQQFLSLTRQKGFPPPPRSYYPPFPCGSACEPCPTSFTLHGASIWGFSRLVCCRNFIHHLINQQVIILYLMNEFFCELLTPSRHIR